MGRVISKDGFFKTEGSITVFVGDVTIKNNTTYETHSGVHYRHSYDWGKHWTVNGGMIWK